MARLGQYIEKSGSKFIEGEVEGARFSGSQEYQEDCKFLDAKRIEAAWVQHLNQLQEVLFRLKLFSCFQTHCTVHDASEADAVTGKREAGPD